ncbi:MAG: RNA-splicing ligase RtcB [Isosphaera sp.]|nr:RNA-splicing ligase RtcB [Isosphaera sp.]
MAKPAFAGPLEKIGTNLWRIPREYKPGMRVDGHVFASDALIESIRKDQAPDQVANVATLPGIQHASLAMPDIHWGYGFCIGGVCATDPEEGGVISPGGVGYDINCLTPDARVLHRHGYTRPIGDMAAAWRTAELACHDLDSATRTATTACRWFGQQPRSPVLELRAAAGDAVRATADHPFWTPDGMKPLGELKPGDRVARSPFEGVPFEPPTDEVILSEEAFRAALPRFGVADAGNGAEQVVTYLKERGLLPLRYSSPATPVLCKLAGFVFGDGSLHFDKSGKGVVSFHAKAEDLEDIRADIASLGVTASRVYRRDRTHTITTAYKTYTFDRTEEWFKVVGRSFAALLASLGVPVGPKAKQDYGLPGWLEAAPLWHRRLFLAALFGAELSTPATVPGHDTVFATPVLSVSKRGAGAAGGAQLLDRLAAWLAGFGVTVQKHGRRDEQVNPDGDRSVRLRLVVANDSANLVRLWSRVGFEYNRERAALAAVAVQYLKEKERAVGRREVVAASAVALAAAGTPRADIFARLVGPDANTKFVERSLYGGRKSRARVADGFTRFAAFLADRRVGSGGMVWDVVESIDPVPDYDGLVYDFTVNHPDHNFVANGFVVSNCGVRLVKTNLFLDDVKHRVRELVKELFYTIPSGAGRTGRYKFDPVETRRLMGEGPKFVIDRDLGVPRDLVHTESNGRIPDGDPHEVSDHAVKRGAEQCGTLGSGNHFLEVQVVDAVLDGDVAAAFGLELNQVCVMIHSGSRGLGYQVCDDALATFRNCPAKYGIDLPDRQLACAPVDTPEGRKYIAAMRAAANYGFCNRQLLMQQAREVFASVFGRSWEDLGMELLYDVAHNIAKLEEHTVGGKRKKVWVHRKGATRAFPAGHPEVPAQFRAVGQPVIIPGDMGRASWVLVGGAGSMEKSFGSTCHGAGRAMSRTAAKMDGMGRKIDKELEHRGVIAMAASRAGLAEEQPKAYKNVDDVVDAVHGADLSRKVARMRPIGVIKG